MEMLIILTAIFAGFMISRLYTKYRGPIFDRAEQAKKEAATHKTYKNLKDQTAPFGEEIFFVPSLFTVMDDAEKDFGKPLNQNEFNRVKNSALAKFVDKEEVRDWADLNNGRANNFNFADWQKWRAEDGA